MRPCSWLWIVAATAAVAAGAGGCAGAPTRPSHAPVTPALVVCEGDGEKVLMDRRTNTVTWFHPGQAPVSVKCGGTRIAGFEFRCGRSPDFEFFFTAGPPKINGALRVDGHNIQVTCAPVPAAEDLATGEHATQVLCVGERQKRVVFDWSANTATWFHDGTATTAARCKITAMAGFDHFCHAEGEPDFLFGAGPPAMTGALRSNQLYESLFCTPCREGECTTLEPRPVSAQPAGTNAAQGPATETGTPISELHVYRSRKELGPLEAEVPRDFPFDSESLVLIGQASANASVECCSVTKPQSGDPQLRIMELEDTPSEDCTSAVTERGWGECMARQQGPQHMAALMQPRSFLARVPKNFSGRIAVVHVPPPPRVMPVQ